ncbi:MAG: GAF domain-containing protein [Chloroflexota bacterium]
MKSSTNQSPQSSKRSLARPLSLRARLVVGNILLAFVAIMAMGYYVYYRTQETNRYLSAQLEQSVQQKAEDTLSTVINEQAAQLNTFFLNKSRNIALLGSTIQNLLLKEQLLNDGTYWDALQSLSQLPSGSWDNANDETASIFVPASVELTPSLISGLNTVIHTDTTVPHLLETNPEIIAIYYGGIAKETIYYPNIDLANLVPPDFDVTSRPWFVAAAPEQNPTAQVIWSDPYQDAALHGLVITGSIPVYERPGQFRGVAAMDIQLNIITELVSGIQAGETGYAMLVDGEHRLIAFPEAGYDDFGLTPEVLPLGEVLDESKLPGLSHEFFELVTQSSSGESGFTTLTIGDRERFVAYRPIAEVGYGLVLIVPSEEMLAESIAAEVQIVEQSQRTVSFSLLLIALMLLGASMASVGLGNALTAPLRALTKTAERVTAGDLDARAEVATRDEIGTLAQTLNTMTASLRASIQSLEQRVAERTADLETARLISDRRVQELETIAEISSVVTGEQNIETLLPLITRLVSQRFDFYHVGIFMIDSTNQFAILQAANSEGGQRMLSRGHRLELASTSIVGHVASRNEPRIALDVGTDAVYFNNPDLPSTRSEMALPLNSRGRTIGVLDVQSDKPGAFTEADTKTLSILADQIATAIENARLFDETQRALNESQVLYSQYSREGWSIFSEEEKLLGYRQTLAGGSRLNSPVETDEIRDAMNRGTVLVFDGDGKKREPEVVVPVKLRGQVIGTITVKASSRDRTWSRDEINLSETVAERLSLALENARLIQDSQRQALKEQTISEVTAKIGSSINLRNVLQTAVEELGRTIPGSDVVIRFGSPNGDAE